MLDCFVPMRFRIIVLLHEDTESALVVDLDHLLAAIGRLPQRQYIVHLVRIAFAHTYEMLSFMAG